MRAQAVIRYFSVSLRRYPFDSSRRLFAGDGLDLCFIVFNHFDCEPASGRSVVRWPVHKCHGVSEVS